MKKAIANITLAADENINVMSVKLAEAARLTREAIDAAEAAWSAAKKIQAEADAAYERYAKLASEAAWSGAYDTAAYYMDKATREADKSLAAWRRAERLADAADDIEEAADMLACKARGVLYC